MGLSMHDLINKPNDFYMHIHLLARILKSVIPIYKHIMKIWQWRLGDGVGPLSRNFVLKCI